MNNKVVSKLIDLAQANTIVFHLPDGEALSLPVEELKGGDLELGLGRVCDTSEINGEIHYFPRGNA